MPSMRPSDFPSKKASRLVLSPHRTINKENMKLDIQSLSLPITTALSEQAKRRLRFALTRHSDRIQRVVVRLGDENGPRGGVDKFCCIQVYLVDAPMAIIKNIDPDLHTAIDRAADRAGRVVAKHLERSRHSGRRIHGDARSLPP